MKPQGRHRAMAQYWNKVDAHCAARLFESRRDFGRILRRGDENGEVEWRGLEMTTSDVELEMALEEVNCKVGRE